ncbi:MAG: carbohydrate ABC transporter permease [Eubacteriales bacterium]|nr:carbohydrate ABC transporter permease [Eubacteriales bacterium]
MNFRWIKKKAAALLRLLVLAVPAVLMLAPVVFVWSGSVMSRQELGVFLGPALDGKDGYISWRLIPDYPTPEHYKKLLLLTPQFFVVFWNSVKMTGSILAGQLLVAVPSAWAFAVYRFKGSRILFRIYIVLMLMPFQVTMLSQYLVLDRLNMMDTHLAIIVPAVFSTFPVFLCYRGFAAIPRELLDAGRIDGAGELMLFFKIGLPLSSGSVLAAMVLGFLEYWNLIEQPLAFLKDKTLWPLSLYLPQIGPEKAGEAFAVSVITLIPAVFAFLLGKDYLEQGIVASGLKA